MSRKVPLQQRRLWFQAIFFLLFLLAPLFDLLRLDLNSGHFYLLGMEWDLGMEALMQGEIDIATAALNLFGKGFLPLAAATAALIWASWHYGRLYCGWLCPHFSIVELINTLMLRAGGRPTLWEKRPLPERRPDSRRVRPDPRLWTVAILAALLLAFIWAVALLTYLLPPEEVYGNLIRLRPTFRQGLFIGVVTLVLSLDFLFARHLFCRYGCSVGLFQSLAWMANRHALVVDFDRSRAGGCGNCNNACDNVCPMRLKPRSIKRRIFTCTQCALCITACEQVQARHEAPPLLIWVQGEAAIQAGGPPPAERRNPGRWPVAIPSESEAGAG